ncbi:uncharacterized protein L3040_008771 [Drepanopeziza brunnea f. sp. 'multigermtubi']|uniref:SNF2 N-terminal domain-containing protein n=1 Tax=Marssonina brunnea f. sp. multigermtubi (strain MB_m1) TaxID=1072389 RepID=K1XD45_MARBU|nr:uncharacterized protein MBM_02965 [Drepanopeziza brunnea f. sp. 'multigermtubi' MB_m1]EKD18723.1 hypothetical protein MBM_02965 [Drepanopeziza brunnea f. sp. 'multigermtubi' MB_m1]KAJ5033659.1 hypothetical protein L3040_008771 [Drepanopeziza brunnea f. sp. 'multigermtubi']
MSTSRWFELQAEIANEFSNAVFQCLEYSTICEELGFDHNRPRFEAMSPDLILTPGQVTGIGWTVRRFSEDHNPTMMGQLIADFCGSGKTGIAIGIILYLEQLDKEGRAHSVAEGNRFQSSAILLAVPLNVCSQLVSELQRWAPALKFERYYNAADPDPIRAQDFAPGGRFDLYEPDNPHLFLTTFTYFSTNHPAPWMYDANLNEYSLNPAYDRSTSLANVFEFLLVDEADQLKKGVSGTWGAAFVALKARKRTTFTAILFPNRISDMIGMLELLEPPPDRLWP